mmetsp:Transcript_57/g.158  ORF Transcript_57/g.158 Transcript_57/m.158 type:complete len:105 (-) Transcript_57:777-1091(-)
MTVAFGRRCRCSQHNWLNEMLGLKIWRGSLQCKAQSLKPSGDGGLGLPPQGGEAVYHGHPRGMGRPVILQLQVALRIQRPGGAEAHVRGIDRQQHQQQAVMQTQ